MKAWFDAERATWESDKVSLAKRAEEAESQLKPVTGELTGLKEHITHMAAAISGKFNMHSILVTRLASHTSYAVLTHLATLI